MLDFVKKNKLITGVVVLAVLALLYWALFGNASSGVPLLTSSADSSVPASQDLLVTLTNLRTIKLDDSVFRDPVFISLTDFGVSIPPEAVGRSNPFAPVGGSAASPSSQSTLPGNL